jgi:hypothetical protein
MFICVKPLINKFFFVATETIKFFGSIDRSRRHHRLVGCGGGSIDFIQVASSSSSSSSLLKNDEKDYE